MKKSWIKFCNPKVDIKIKMYKWGEILAPHHLSIPHNHTMFLNPTGSFRTYRLDTCRAITPGNSATKGARAPEPA